MRLVSPLMAISMMRISTVAKGHKIGPARTLSSLTIPQIRMILRIYWTDRYQRRALGCVRGTLGIRTRLAHQFDVSIEVIKKVVAINHSQRQNRFKTISLKDVQRGVRKRLHQQGMPIKSGTPGRPRKHRVM